jgi:dTDP-glucose 4,6-dehydratase
MKDVLVTGAAGFVGSHCLEYWLDKTDWRISIIDSFRHKGTFSRLDAVPNLDLNRVKIFHHDLSAPIDRQLENRLLDREVGVDGENYFDYIINIASDSAVERSITDPGQCWKNNCDLMFNILEFARKNKPSIFLHFSTDEVYGEAEPNQAHHEWDVIMPSNPYSASKAAQEALAIAYWRTYDIPLILINVMNVIGERQDTEKFLPKLIYKIATNQTMDIYGEPGKIGSRYYIHGKNIADAINFLTHVRQQPPMYSDGNKRPDRYNVVGDLEMDNLQVAEFVAECMGKKLEYRLIPAEKARKGYDRRYALDGKKLHDLGWRHPVSTLESIKRIVDWTLKNPHWIL